MPKRTRRVLCTAAALAAVAAGVASSPQASAATPSPAVLEAFLHPLHGGAWTSHELRGVSAGIGAPSVAFTPGGVLVVVTRSPGGELSVAEGSATGTLSTTDLAVVAAAPLAAGRATVVASRSRGVDVWYRTTSGALEVIAQPSAGATWTATDVSAAASGPLLAGDPTVVSLGGGSIEAFAVTVGGGIVEFTQPEPGTWSEADPTGGLPFDPLAGSLAVVRSPDASGATVIVATTPPGDVVELSNELAGLRAAVGPWHVTNLTDLGVPPAASQLSGLGASTPDTAYLSWAGHVISLTLASGLPSGFADTDLTSTDDAAPANGAAPTLVASPSGGAIAMRTVPGDLTLLAARGAPRDTDISFQRGTAELVASDVGSATYSGGVALVSADGGPIAPTLVQRRILLLASSFDQDHVGLQTTPRGSDCNPFTAAFGRGSTWGCKSGTAAEAWCSDFAQWVWQTAGVPTGGITGWSATFATWGAAHHRVQFGTRFRAKVGDAIVWGTRAPLYGTHVAIIVAVVGRYIDVESGNSGGDLPGYVEGVWRSGLFIGSTSTVSGYPVLAVVSP